MIDKYNFIKYNCENIKADTKDQISAFNLWKNVGNEFYIWQINNNNYECTGC